MKYFNNLITCVFVLSIINIKLLASNSYLIESVINLGGSYYPTSILKINDKGNVIGLHNVNERHQIFFYDNSIKSVIGIEPLNIKYSTYPLDFNDNDVIIGYTDVDDFNPQQGRVRETHVIMWKNLIAHDLTPILGIVNNVKSNQFASINNSETLVGFGFKKNYSEMCSSILLAQKNKKERLLIKARYGKLYTRLIALNEKGDAAGGVMYGDQNFFGVGHGGEIPKAIACLWDGKRKKIISLGNLMGDLDKYSFATNLNDRFQAVGSSEIDIHDSNGQYFWHAFFWENSNFIDLGSLEPNEDSLASSINNQGEVVGVSGGIMMHPTIENKPSKGFYWSKESGLLDLNSMIDKNLGWKILQAKDINNHGQIVGFASKNGEVHVILLTPLK